MRVERPWIVQHLAPRDWFMASTLSVEEWIHNAVEVEPHPDMTRAEAWSEFLSAVAAVTKVGSWEWRLRSGEEPRVAYDAKGDTEYFIFKIDNNGTTFLVSHDGIDVGDQEYEREAF